MEQNNKDNDSEYDEEGIGCNNRFFKDGRWQWCIKGNLCENCVYASDGEIKPEIWNKAQYHK